MKKNDLIRIAPFLLILLFALLTPQVLWFSGFFAMAILLLGLRKFDLKRALIIISPIIVYPLVLIFLVLFGFLPLVNMQNGLFIYDILFAFGYFFIFRNVSDWLDSRKKLYVAASLVILVVIMLAYLPLVDTCDFFYYGGGKGAHDLINRCDNAGLLVRSYEHAKFKLSGINSSIIIYNVVFTVGAVILAMFMPTKTISPK